MKEKPQYLYPNIGWIHGEKDAPARIIASAHYFENKNDHRNDGWQITKHVEEWEYTYYFKVWGKDPSHKHEADNSVPIPEQLKGLVIP